MTRFQLCLLAVFMLLVSNCVADSAMGTTQEHSHFDTPQRAINKEHKGTLLSHATQRRSLGSQARIMMAEVPGSTDNKENKVEVNGQNSVGKGKTNGTPDGPPVSNASPEVPANGVDSGRKSTSPEVVQPVVQKENEGTELDKAERPKDSPIQDDKTGGNPKQESPVKEGSGKANPPPDEATTESTTTEPAAEGYSTAVSSDFTSTSTQSPTETLRGSDSQSSVRAGVGSFVLGIGIVLAIYI